jgi:hypothetical protein
MWSAEVPVTNIDPSKWQENIYFRLLASRQQRSLAQRWTHTSLNQNFQCNTFISKRMLGSNSVNSVHHKMQQENGVCLGCVT